MIFMEFIGEINRLLLMHRAMSLALSPSLSADAAAAVSPYWRIVCIGMTEIRTDYIEFIVE